ncbi:hypothetical protein [Pseudomonas sp. Irchel 3E13]|uniref:hypothetical protein n=1 Tax=Pseudomonas sp. Irchel 3E13 TaxID=2008975 RepID=UPI000BA37DE1|nr:hypothetical protein [Pseudomonas sp. Irchel 3E13]
MPVGICKLCKSETELRLSHFIPKFVGKWVKETSATGYIRMNHSINKRSQDIAKEYWLCGECEQLFSGWEREFANKIFYPMVDKKNDTARYGDWLAKFCASLSWRTLTYVRSVNPAADSDTEEKATAAENALADYLLGKSTNLGEYEQHLYPVEGIASSDMTNLPKNINRYLLRTMQMDIVSNTENMIIFTKLPGFILMGLTGHPEAKEMRSSRVALGDGILKPRKYTFPSGVGDYIFAKAEQIAETYKTMSPSQQKMIDASIRKNPQRAAKSGTIEAFEHDLSMFGPKIFN